MEAIINKEGQGVVFEITDQNMESVFLDFYVPLKIFAERMVGAEEGHDLVMQVFVKLFETRKRQVFESHAKLRNYLYVSIKNTVFGFLKNQKRERSMIADLSVLKDKYSENAVFMAEAIRVIDEGIEKLPERYQAVIKLAKVGKTTAEISSELGIKEVSVRSNLLRARRNLKNHLFDGIGETFLGDPGITLSIVLLFSIVEQL